MASASGPLDEVVKSQDVSNALLSIKRTIRMSCTASSPQYLVLGAQTGSLYFFERNSFRFIQLCVFEDLQEPISAIAFSPDEKLLAFATAPPHRNIYITNVPIKTRRRKVCPIINHLKFAEGKKRTWTFRPHLNLVFCPSLDVLAPYSATDL